MSVPPIASTVLTRPQTEPRNLRSLKNLIEDGTIDLSPSYQRDVVWKPLKQSYLIDSLRNHYYVPPVVFALRQNAEGRWILNVVDGKQRLTSVLQYYNNSVPSRPPKDTGGDQTPYNFSQKSTYRSKVLSEEEQRRFDMLEIICVQYIGLTEVQERELFQRMQMGMSLTNSEKLHAVDSLTSDLVGVLISTYPILNKVLTTTRHKVTFLVSQLLYMLCNGNKLQIPSMDLTNRFLREKFLSESEDAKIDRVFKRLCGILEEYHDFITAANKNTVTAPVEFIFFALMIAKKPRLTKDTQLMMYLNCHHYVRLAHPGQVRANPNVLATLQDIVDDGRAFHMRRELYDVWRQFYPTQELPEELQSLPILDEGDPPVKQEPNFEILSMPPVSPPKAPSAILPTASKATASTAPIAALSSVAPTARLTSLRQDVATPGQTPQSKMPQQPPTIDESTPPEPQPAGVEQSNISSAVDEFRAQQMQPSAYNGVSMFSADPVSAGVAIPSYDLPSEAIQNAAIVSSVGLADESQNLVHRLHPHEFHYDHSQSQPDPLLYETHVEPSQFMQPNGFHQPPSQSGPMLQNKRQKATHDYQLNGH